MLAERRAEVTQLLISAGASGSRVDLSSVLDLTIDDAYLIQNELIRTAGLIIRGFKVSCRGFANKSDRFVSMPICRNIFSSPYSLYFPTNRSGEVTSSLVFEIGRDFQPGRAPYRIDDLVSSVVGVALGADISSSSFSSKLRDLDDKFVIADVSATVAFVHGNFIYDWRVRQVDHVEGGWKNVGTGVTVATIPASFTNPLRAVLHLINQQCALGRGVRAGEFVAVLDTASTVQIEPGGTVQFSSMGLGKLDINFSLDNSAALDNLRALARLEHELFARICGAGWGSNLRRDLVFVLKSVFSDQFRARQHLEAGQHDGEVYAAAKGMPAECKSIASVDDEALIGTVDLEAEVDQGSAMALKNELYSAAGIKNLGSARVHRPIRSPYW